MADVEDVTLGRPVDQARLINCRDFADRPRHVIVFSDQGRVVLVAPAGEVAIMSTLQADQLRTALAAAMAEQARVAQGEG
jgi:hypothetical protein